MGRHTSSCWFCAGMMATMLPFADSAGAQGHDPPNAMDVARARRALQAVIATADFGAPMPLARFVRAMEERMPPQDRVALRFDEAAFGKDLHDILQAPVRMPAVPRRMAIATALRLALSQDPDNHEYDFSVRARYVAITTPAGSAYTQTYDVSDLAPRARQVARRLPTLHGPDVATNSANTGPALLAHLIAKEIDPEDWGGAGRLGRLQIRNGTKLVIQTTASKQEQIEDMLAQYRRMLDLAVIMDARLIEVERAFYERELAPLFARKGPVAHDRLVVPVDAKMVALLQKENVILRGDPLKILPEAEEVFLSWHDVTRRSSPDGRDLAPPLDRAALTGFSLRVRPDVSADARCLRLRISQETVVVSAVVHSTVRDVVTGAQTELRTPSIRRIRRADVIEIHDLQPIVIAVDFPALAGRAWVALAEPRIYIDAEKDIAAAEKAPAGAAELPNQEKPRPDTKPQEPMPLPADPDVVAILKAIVQDMLTSPDFKESRALYGTAGDRGFALRDGDIGWPRAFAPDVPGFQLRSSSAGHCPGFENRLLGIRLDHFNLKKELGRRDHATVSLCLVNVRGIANGAPIGGCIVEYQARRADRQWIVEWISQIDP